MHCRAQRAGSWTAIIAAALAACCAAGCDPWLSQRPPLSYVPDVGGLLKRDASGPVTTDAGGGDAPTPGDAGAPDDGGSPPLPDAGSPGCTGPYAYLHGDLWPYWYNFRVCCDAEHKSAWRCERLNGVGAAICSGLKTRYEGCVQDPNGEVCPNWGVCCYKQAQACGTPQDDDPPLMCTTSSLDYDSESVWGTYYGMQWSTPTIHRFTTVKVWDAADQLIAAFSSNPQDGYSYMEGLANQGVGPEPQGHIQLSPQKSDRFGSFACIRLPAGAPLKVQGFWINEFAHTCKSNYWSYPDVPCWTEKLSLTPRPGFHYLFTDRGVQELPGCDGPPAEIRARLPAASCSTAN